MSFYFGRGGLGGCTQYVIGDAFIVYSILPGGSSADLTTGSYPHSIWNIDIFQWVILHILHNILFIYNNLHTRHVGNRP